MVCCFVLTSILCVNFFSVHWLPATTVVVKVFDSTVVNESLYELPQRRQEELEKKAEELARKEEELKNAGGGTGR